MNKSLLEAYSLLEKLTPLKNEDCGYLCNARCCKASVGDAMELFPGERELFENVEGFEIIEDGERVLLRCSGKCDRHLRPLSCRIYPLFPLHYVENGTDKIKVIFDPRSNLACPLNGGAMKLDRLFVRAVRRSGKLLMRDEKCAAQLKETSEYLSEMIELMYKLI